MKVRSAGSTDRGLVRQNNEDAFIADDRLRLYAVADGVGGLEAGEFASRTVIETLVRSVASSASDRDTTPSRGIPRNRTQELSSLRSAVFQANQLIFTTAEGTPGHGGMGTTVTALLLRNDQVFVAHVGDSRAYRLRGKTLKQLTRDHTLLEDQIAAGTITRDEARRSPYQHVITRAVGISRDITVDAESIPLKAGDRILLCTDGLTDLVPDAEIASIMRSEPPGAAVQTLIRTAIDRGGKDNVTAVIVEAADEMKRS